MNNETKILEPDTEIYSVMEKLAEGYAHDDSEVKRHFFNGACAAIVEMEQRPKETLVFPVENLEQEFNTVTTGGELPETKELRGVIFKYSGGDWGPVAVHTNTGDYAIIKNDWDWALEHIGETVTVKMCKDIYKTVEIVKAVEWPEEKRMGDERDYWKQRCEAAENLVEAEYMFKNFRRSTNQQELDKAYKAWLEIKNKKP